MDERRVGIPWRIGCSFTWNIAATPRSFAAARNPWPPALRWHKMSDLGLERGSAGYRRLTLAMLFAGFSTFSLLYSVQPLLPLFARDFGVSA